MDLIQDKNCEISETNSMEILVWSLQAQNRWMLIVSNNENLMSDFRWLGRLYHKLYLQSRLCSLTHRFLALQSGLIYPLNLKSKLKIFTFHHTCQFKDFFSQSIYLDFVRILWDHVSCVYKWIDAISSGKYLPDFAFYIHFTFHLMLFRKANHWKSLIEQKTKSDLELIHTFYA
jgi:hypothetical protein